MHDIFSREPDPLDDLLAPPSLPPEREALQQRIYQRTRRVLARHRRMRQIAYAAALLGSFAIGAAVMRVALRPGPPELGERGASAPRSSQQQGADAPRSPMPAEESALAQEWQAFDSEGHRGELYRQAGDRYMAEKSDLQSALRCYANALDSGTKQDLTISPDDNWLLMAIKDARQKESDHAKTGG